MNQVEVGPEVLKALQAFVQAKALAKQAEAEKLAAEQILRAALNGANQATMGGVVVYSLVSRQREGLDTKSIAEQHPEIYEAFKTITGYDFIKTA